MDLSQIHNHLQAGDQTLGLMPILAQKWKVKRCVGGMVQSSRTHLNLITIKTSSGMASVHKPTFHYQTKQIITTTGSRHQDWIIAVSKENRIRKKTRLV